MRLGLSKTLNGCTVAATLLLSTFAIAPAAHAEEKLVVWWNKGFYSAEEDALLQAIHKFEAKTGVKVELSQYATQDVIPKTVAALDSGTVPDVAYADTFNFQSVGKWAAEGKLEDLGAILTPMKDQFDKSALDTVMLQNEQTKSKSYYAFPVKQATLHLHYWKDMLEEAGLKESDIPKDWHGFWNFWCDKAQPAVRKASGKRVYGIGLPMGVDSSDSLIGFLTFAEAYNVVMVDDSGKLLLDDPKVKAGLVSALRDYTEIYKKGCVPSSATSWKDADNNVAFHNKTTVMTFNPTISIPGKWLDDSTNQTLTAEQRDEAKKNYEERIRTLPWPSKPDGTPMHTRSSVVVGVIFQQAKNKARAKEFVQFLLQDENLQPYVEGALGRWFPVKTAAVKSAFWNGDEHRKILRDQFAAGVGGYEMTRNYKFTTVNNENVWAKATIRVVLDKVPPEQAVDEMIDRIKKIVSE
ncbi:carbohydrate ABC transporter substrate-binding protein [Bradyrhizobium manausense]|uniref:ABC transporter substrate-binding protein n=1 Tax=Bradyrhizobium manausense TaxID=989370 RepID=UPI001BA62D22|nr:ABC transporter substrate-binding protein [Bradyrhizobium manausense]MBR0833811.1 carbohydrate ABC transporter substrate-binding protein [Bradyrhizobium manausense]